jgi:hypothetical protein
MPKNIVYDSAVMLCAANALCQEDDVCWPLCHPATEEK